MIINKYTHRLKSSLYNWLPYGYGTFMAGFFFIPNSVDHYKFFSIAIFIPVFLLSIDLLVTVKRHPLWLLIVSYLIWMLITSFWSENFSWLDFFKTLRLVLYILAFILITVHLMIARPELLRKIAVVVCICAGVAALISIPLWYLEHPFPDSRLVGIGPRENTNTSSYLYGFHALLSLSFGLRERTTVLKRLLYGNTVILLIFVFLTQSNTGILATTLGMALLLVAGRFNTRVVKLLGTLVLAYSLFFLASSTGLTDKPIDSGFADRIKIWQTVLDYVQEAPLAGHGYQKPPRLNPDNNLEHPYYTHNTLLGTLRDGGIIGGIFYIVILLYAMRSSILASRETGSPLYLACLIFGIICMLTDTDEVITRPRELWLILWLPLAILIGLNIRQDLPKNESISYRTATSSETTPAQP